jgi:hypothetical protein
MNAFTEKGQETQALVALDCLMPELMLKYVLLCRSENFAIGPICGSPTLAAKLDMLPVLYRPRTNHSHDELPAILVKSRIPRVIMLANYAALMYVSCTTVFTGSTAAVNMPIPRLRQDLHLLIKLAT